MEKFTTLQSVAAPLPIANINTDVVIRIERMSKHGRGELGPWALEALRLRPDGSEDPEFILNRPGYRGARILLAGANFGCGSSREMAVWALEEIGIRCIIAPSFGDIFFGNCLQNGVLAIRLPDSTVEALVERASRGAAQALLTVDLVCQEILHEGGSVPFEIEPLARESLLQGLDPIGVTLQRESDIAAFEARDCLARPWLFSST